MSYVSAGSSSPDNARWQNLAVFGVYFVALVVAPVSFFILIGLLDAQFAALINFLANVTWAIWNTVFEALRPAFVSVFNWIANNFPSSNG